MKLAIKKIYSMVLVTSLLTIVFVSNAYAYSGSAAKIYADTYWKNYNTAQYETQPYDCTNFVSQCLYAGGIPFDKIGIDAMQWWYDNGMFWDSWSSTWVNASLFTNWLIENSVATVTGRYSARLDDSYGTPPATISANPGDIVGYDWDSNGRTDHMGVFVVSYGQDQSDAPSKGLWGTLTDQHTYNRYHMLWNITWYPDYKFTTMTTFRPK